MKNFVFRLERATPVFRLFVCSLACLNFMKIREILFVGILITFGTSGAAYAQLNLASVQDQDSITVTGFGEVTAEPDLAIISISVSAIDIDANAAKAEADEKYQATLAAIKEESIAKADIKIAAISLNPEYDWDNRTRTLKGTRVNRAITIIVRDLENVARLLQALIESGVSSIDSVQTGFEDRSSLERKALKAAIDDAKEKARFLADQFDRRIVTATSIVERNQPATSYNNVQEVVVSGYRRSAGASLPQEHFGVHHISSQVYVIFHID